MDASDLSPLDQKTEQLKEACTSKQWPTPRDIRFENRQQRRTMAALDQAIDDLSKAVANIGSRPLITLSPYVGKADKRSFQNFIKELNKVGTSYGWSEPDLCRHLPVYLKSEAAAIYDELTAAQKANWRTLCYNMAQRLGSGEST